MTPQVVIPNFEGYHNSLTEASKSKKGAYRDLSTICIVPAIKAIPPKIVQAYRNLMAPMNQRFIMMMIEGMEVGAAYSETIAGIVDGKYGAELQGYRYLLTMETDNAPPPDGLLKLLEDMEDYDIASGLYYTKGIEGKAMSYGRTDVFPVNFIPFEPASNSVTPVRGMGMGFCLFKMEVFKNPKLKRPFFETVQKYEEGKGVQAYTQDLKFAEKVGLLGIKICVDSRVRVGHYDYGQDQFW